MLNRKTIAFKDIIDIQRVISDLSTSRYIGSGCGSHVHRLEVGPVRLVVKREIDERGYTSEEMERFLQIYYEYQKLLEHLGIKSARTIPHFIRQPNGTYKLIIIQEYFKKNEFVDNIVADTSPEAVIALFRELINFFIKLSSYNRDNGRQFSLDFKLENLAVRNGQIILVDNTPLDNGHSSFKSVIFLPYTKIPLFKRDFSDLYDNIFMLYLNFVSRRKELGEELKETIRMALPGNLYEEFCKKTAGKIFIYTFGKRLKILQRLDLLTAYRKRLTEAFDILQALDPYKLFRFIEESA